MDVVTYALSRKYTDNSIAGISGVLAGKNCTIASITPVDGGNLVTFEWVADDSTTHTDTMFVQDGILGENDIAPTYDSTVTYSEGNLVVYNNELYRCTSATTGEFDPSDWESISINEILSEIEIALAGKADSGDVPDELADLSDDSTHRLVTDTEKSTWNAKQNALTFDDAPTENSNNPVKSGGIYMALSGKADTSDIAAIKKDINISTLGYRELVFTDGKYVKADGSIATYNSYSCTQYVDITGYSTIVISSSIASNYCRFYDSSKNPLGNSNFSIVNGITNVDVPANTVYVVMSCKTTNKNDLVLYTDMGANVSGLLADMQKCIKATVELNSSSVPAAPYNNFNTLPVGSVINYIRSNGWSDISNHPLNDRLGSSSLHYRGTVLTYAGTTSTTSGIVQLAMSYSGYVYMRSSGAGTWTSWKEILSGDYSFIADKIISNTPSSPYNDCNTLPSNTAVTYSGTNWNTAANAPNTDRGTILTFCGDSTSAYKSQIALCFNGKTYTRTYGTDGWTNWNDLNKSNFNEDMFFYPFSIWEKFGVIGDSYASGKIYVQGDSPDDQHGTENNNLSWGKILARKSGNQCTLFSTSGLSTYTWLSDNHGLAALNSAEAQQLYLCCLGINDASSSTTPSHIIGTSADIEDSTSTTFYGCYGRIIKAIKAKAPDAKIVLVKVMRSGVDYDDYNTAIEGLATYFSLPCVDPFDDADMSKVIENNKMHGHPTAYGYAGIANVIERIISKCIESEYAYFIDYVG